MALAATAQCQQQLTKLSSAQDWLRAMHQIATHFSLLFLHLFTNLLYFPNGTFFFPEWRCSGPQDRIQVLGKAEVSSFVTSVSFRATLTMLNADDLGDATELSCQLWWLLKQSLGEFSTTLMMGHIMSCSLALLLPNSRLLGRIALPLLLHNWGQRLNKLFPWPVSVNLVRFITPKAKDRVSWEEN